MHIKSSFLKLGSVNLIAIAVVVAQIRPPAPSDKKFDVVSVKPDAPNRISAGCGFSGATFSSPIQFTVTHCSVAALIGLAYGPFDRDRIAGVPKWAESESYSVSAVSTGPVSIASKYAMLQAVLERQFELKWHRETRELPLFVLSGDGTMRLPGTSEKSCRTWDPQVGPPANDPNDPPLCNVWENRVLPDGSLKLQAKGTTLAQLAQEVGRLLGRPGMDATGSGDRFDIDLEFVNPQDVRSATTTGAGVATSITPSAGARQAPVGLALKTGRGPVEIFVVDSVQRPADK